MEKRFVGKVALVTGATHGIGQATAVRLAAEGAVVGVNQRPSGDPAETLAKIKEVGGEAFPVVADMRNPAQIVEMIGQVAERGGRLDYVVSNAAINPFMPWDKTTVEDYDALSETNLRGTWVVTTESAKQMIKEGHGGAMVCVSSISAHVGSPFQSAYCATKGGISMWVKAVRFGDGHPWDSGQCHRAGLDRDPDVGAHVRRRRGDQVLRGEDRSPSARPAGGDGSHHCLPPLR